MYKDLRTKNIELSAASRALLPSSLNKEEVKVSLCDSFPSFFFS